MQNNNNTIDMQNESLEDAIKQHTNNLPHATMRATSFKAGANWQQQKDKAVQDKLIEALKNVIARCEFELEGMKVLNDIEFIRAKQLLNEIEKETI